MSVEGSQGDADKLEVRSFPAFACGQSVSRSTLQHLEVNLNSRVEYLPSFYITL